MSSFKIEWENFRMPCQGAGGEKIVYITTPFWVRGLLPTIYNLILRCFIIISMLTRGEMIRSAWKTFFDPHEFARNLNSLTVLLHFEFLPKLKNFICPMGKWRLQFTSLITKSSPELLDTIFSLHAGLTLNLEKFKCLGDGVKAYFTIIIVLLKVPQHT